MLIGTPGVFRSSLLMINKHHVRLSGTCTYEDEASGSSKVGVLMVVPANKLIGTPATFRSSFDKNKHQQKQVRFGTRTKDEASRSSKVLDR
jgi:hypothetical protein